MAYQMPYTDERTGAVFPASVWVPLNVVPILYPDQYGIVTFVGFASLDLAQQSLAAIVRGQGKSWGAIGTKDYRLSAEQIRPLLLAPTNGPNELTTLSAVAYAHQQGCNDVPDPTDSEPNRKRNFFAGATWVDALPG